MAALTLAPFALAEAAAGLVIAVLAIEHKPPKPPPPSGRPAPPPSAQGAVDVINARFRRNPFGAWDAGGLLADAGVLIHCFDSYEDHDRPWSPGTGGGASGDHSGELGPPCSA